MQGRECFEKKVQGLICLNIHMFFSVNKKNKNNRKCVNLKKIGMHLTKLFANVDCLMILSGGPKGHS